MHKQKRGKKPNNNKKNLSSKKVQNSNKTSESSFKTIEMSSINDNNENLTSAPKRARDPMQNSFLDNVLKTPRLSTNDSPFKLINLVDKRLEKFTDVIKTCIEESEARMLKEFEKRFDEMKSDINNITERVSKLEMVADDIVSLKSEVDKLKAQLQRQENSIIASDLRINGIPYDENEDLYQMFQTICGTLGINTPAVKAIYRLQNYNNKGKDYSPNAVIMVKLFSPYDKNFVLKSVANFRKRYKTSLLLNHIGHNSDSPFYVNENLTSTNFKILQAAVALKKANKLKSAFTLRGLIYIKFNPDEQPIRIESMDELNNFFPDLCISNSN